MDKADVERFARRTEGMRERVARLFRSAQSGASPDLLASAFEELQIALDELRFAADALHDQDQQLLISAEALETERRYYQDLFEHAPIGYLITSVEGTIRQANAPAAELLGTPARQLIGRSLALFVPEGGRRAFRSRMPELCQSKGPHEWCTQLQPWESPPHEVLLLVAPVFDSTGRAAALRWMVHRLADSSLQPADRETGGHDLEQHVALLNGQLEDLRSQITALARQATTPLQAREVGANGGRRST